MVIKNVNIVTPNETFIGYVCFENGVITQIGKGEYFGEGAIDKKGLILMPGFIDIHVHGCGGIDFMDATAKDYEIIANKLYQEGVTTFLATTLTSDRESLSKVCKTVSEIKNDVPSLGGIHFEGPYINAKYKGAQNEEYIRTPDIEEFTTLNIMSNNNVRYISLAPEIPGASNFISYASRLGVTVSAGHSDASLNDIRNAIKLGLTNTTHTHNAMSGHHHRNPGIVSAAFYYSKLFTEFICDGIHVSKDALKVSYKIIGPDRFIIVTDALKIKHSDLEEFELFGLPCIKKDGAAYLKSGPLAGSLLTMDQGLRNMYEYCKCSLSDLSKISSYNAAKSLHFNDRGIIKVGNLADFVLLDSSLKVKETYKLGKKVYGND